LSSPVRLNFEDVFKAEENRSEPLIVGIGCGDADVLVSNGSVNVG